MTITGPIPYQIPNGGVFVPSVGPVFTPQELDLLRTYMMVPKVFATPNSLLEGIFLGINNLVNDPIDLGWTQYAIRQVLFNLTQLEANLAILDNTPIMSTININGKVMVDPQGTAFMYRYIEGPALISRLSSRLAFFPDKNYFAPAKLTPTADHISYRRPKYI